MFMKKTCRQKDPIDHENKQLFAINCKSWCLVLIYNSANVRKLITIQRHVIVNFDMVISTVSNGIHVLVLMLNSH